MTEQEVYNYLRKHPDRWFTVQEITKVFNVRPNGVLRSLNSAYHRGNLVRTERSRRGRNYSYYWKFKS